MNWQEIKISADNTYFLFEGKHIFSSKYIEVLKFHSPGLAPVKDDSGSFHIDITGKPLYPERFTRTFGYYCNRATVEHNGNWFHLDEKGTKTHSHSFAWSGNYQENLCSVRDANNNYFHIDINGAKIYPGIFIYVGDYKDEIACVKTTRGLFKHIDNQGNFLNDKEFLDLGVFHKRFATAQDKDGWHHIDINGKEIYKSRFSAVEPFYNGFAVVTQFDNQKIIIDESGRVALKI